MAWLEITIDTVSEKIDSVVTSLTAAGFADLVIEDQEEFETFLDQNREYWDYIDEELQEKLQGLSRIKIYLEDTDEAGLKRLEDWVKWLKLSMKVEVMPEVDWEESWKDNYPAQEVGQKLIVLPYWLSEGYEGDRTPVILDPGLTFGTGAHPSTQMVMEFMEELVKPGSACLDLGSGSGILSLAALRLGASSALGVDIDPKAEGIARENAAYNGFAAPEFTACTGNVLSDKKLMAQLKGSWDVVLVNIVADVIVSLAPVLPQFLGKDSILILSGILDTRLADVTAAVERAGLKIQKIRAKEEWRCLEVTL